MLTDNIKHNKAKCKLCGDVIESTHRHDFRVCRCGEITVDGGRLYLRRGFKDPHNLIELSEYYTKEEWDKCLAYTLTKEYTKNKQKYEDALFEAIVLAERTLRK